MLTERPLVCCYRDKIASVLRKESRRFQDRNPAFAKPTIPAHIEAGEGRPALEIRNHIQMRSGFARPESTNVVLNIARAQRARYAKTSTAAPSSKPSCAGFDCFDCQFLTGRQRSTWPARGRPGLPCRRGSPRRHQTQPLDCTDFFRRARPNSGPVCSRVPRIPEEAFRRCACP